MEVNTAVGRIYDCVFLYGFQKHLLFLRCMESLTLFGAGGIVSYTP